jgi:hypothetical protein
MNTCGTCKYKGELSDVGHFDESQQKGYFFCERIQHDHRWKYEEGNRALVIDGSGYYAALCVEDDFGCNQWEAKL